MLRRTDRVALIARLLRPRTAPPARRRRVERRGGPAPFRVPERRTGFDRRSARGSLHYLRERPDMLLVMLVGLNLLSALDWLCTVTALANGAVEANPVVLHLLGRDPFLAGVVKLLAMGAVSLGIWLGRRHRHILATGRAVFILYGLLIAYEVAGLSWIGVL